jgi:type I restriction enzyme S subunit
MNWRTYQLDQLGHVSRGRSRHRPRDAAHLYGGPFPFIQTGDIKHAGLYITEYRQTYNEVGLAQSKLWPAGTLCITIAANIADTSILGIDACFPDSVIGFIPHPNEADARFVKYLFDATIQKRVQQFTQGAAQDNLSQEKLLSLEFKIPRIEEQQRIASILSTYDDLIENNRRRMALLEDAARQVYQEWFVRLRFPGYEHIRIVDGVPEGWEKIQLQGIINVTHGCAFQGCHFSEKPTSRLLTTPGNFRIGGGIKFDKLKFYSEEGPLELAYVFKPMDLMLTMTDLSKMCDTLGFPAFVPKLDGQTFLHNQRIGKVVPLGIFFPKHFLYCLLCNAQYRHHVVGAATGTTVKHTSPKRILSYTTTMPKLGTLIDTFEDFARPLFLQINSLIETNQKLRTARDLLLPKLMSGEISV